MAWNKPGGDDKDPWSGRDDQEGPPDLDEAIRSLQKKLNSLFGGNSNNTGEESGGAGGNQNESSGISSTSLAILAAGAVALWVASGFYIVEEGNHAVVTRFGEYITTKQAGLKWHLPTPIEQVSIVDVNSNSTLEVGYRSSGKMPATDNNVPEEALILTQDENILAVHLEVQYQIKNAQQFLFNLTNPEATLRQVTESAERSVIGNYTMDAALLEEHSKIESQIKQEIQTELEFYQSGIQIGSVSLKGINPPIQVQDAFSDANKASEDKKRSISEAESYSGDLISKAQVIAARKIQEAEGYKKQKIAQATGEVSRFSQLLSEYKKAPAVTRQRIYLESMESVLRKSNTVMVDVKSNSLVLPLDKLPRSSAASDAEAKALTTSTTTDTVATKLKSSPIVIKPLSRPSAEERGRSEVREERARFVREERVRE